MDDIRDELDRLSTRVEELQESLQSARKLIEGLNAQNGEVAACLSRGDVMGAARILYQDAGRFIPAELR